MGQALYRKYRSKSFSEVIGQEPITETLQKAIKSGRISHAYLLAGPKGVGKTSVARILAHEINDLAYKDDSIHLDIIEIDAASNRRIDEIRDIREKVHIAPTSAKYKVYIIDEVHMLTKEAFNALLKTLEEPPAHCIFILATTEAHKLPETIISRTQRFTFKPVEKDKAVSHLRSIAKKEKIDIEPNALELLAEHGGGSFRDSISMLDQLSALGHKITERDVEQMLGLPRAGSLEGLVAHINDGEGRGAMKLLHQLRASGANPALLAAQLSKSLRSKIIAGENYDWAPSLLKNLLDVSAAHQPFELLEISVLEAAQQNVDKQPKLPAAKVPEDVHGLNFWPEIIRLVRQRAPALYTALRLAEPHLNGRILTLGFQFPLHKKKVNESRHIMVISEIIEEVTGARLEIRCSLAQKAIKRTKAASANAPKAEKSEDLAAISSIFGNAELLES